MLARTEPPTRGHLVGQRVSVRAREVPNETGSAARSDALTKKRRTRARHRAPRLSGALYAGLSAARSSRVRRGALGVFGGRSACQPLCRSILLQALQLRAEPA